MSAGEALLEVRGLDAAYGRAQVLFGLDLKVGTGEAVALVGRNGAGKSTTMKALMGLVRPQAGEVRLADASLAGLPPHRIARAGLGYVPEERRIFSELTVAENLAVGRRAPHAGDRAWTPERLIELFPNLAGMMDRAAGRTSGGEQQMLTIARTLMGNPRLLLLDEPSEGIAPLIVERLAETLTELKRTGLTLLLSEQNLRFAARVCDRAYVLEKGRVVWSGPMAELMADEAARRRWLAV